MTALIDWSVARTRMILALIALALFAGVTAYLTLPRQGAPEVDIPSLYVSVTLDGASAADVERLVLKPLEQEVRDLQTLKTMDTFAEEGHGSALLEFESGWDKSARLADLRDRVDRAAAEMPDAIDEPTITEISLQEIPIIVVSVSGTAPERARLQAAKALERAIESLPQVLEVDLAGVRDEVIEAELDPAKMEALGVSPLDLVRLVQSNNRLVAAGALEQGAASTPISLPGSLETPAEAAEIPVVAEGDRIVRLGELATLRRTFEDAQGYARYNGEPTMALQVKKRADANIIETVAAVKAAAEAAQAGWSEPLRNALHIGFALDLSVEVEDMVGQLEASVFTAVALVMLVVFLALGVRSALLVGFAVPTSFLLAFALFAALDYDIDNMVMFGLILAVGMLVDGAIVVAELAERNLDEGMAPDEAYAAAAKRMFWPIISSTATTLSAFLPMLFWPGLPGEFMALLPITLIFVLSASLASALVFLPVVGAMTGAAAAFIGRLADRALGRPDRAARRAAARARRAGRPHLYSRFIRAVIGSPLAVAGALALTIGVVIGAFTLYQSHDKGVEFFVETEPQRAFVYVRALGDFSAPEKDRLVRQVEERVLAVDGVGAVFAFTGGGGIAQFGGETPQDAIGTLQIELEPWQTRFERGRRGALVLEDMREAIGDVPGVTPELRQQEDAPTQGKPIQLLLASDRPEQLFAATEAARALFADTEGVISIDDTRPLPGIQWRLDVDRAAAGRFGADIDEIGALVSLATRGVTLDDTTPDDSDEAIDVLARFAPEERTLDRLDGLRLATASGMAPLSNFVERSVEPATGAIARRDGMRFFLVRGDVAPGVNVTETIARIGASLDQMAAERPALFAGLERRFIGEQEDQEETEAFLSGAMIAALGLIFIILLAQFNSVFNAALVLSAVAMSVAGVVIGIMVMDQTFSIIMTGTGVVALAGIVVNNNIVLIDTYQEYRKHLRPLEAIARTAEHRLRPVLLTTLTTMAGLAPMMFAASVNFATLSLSIGAPSALWWVQLATAVVFGLGFATLLTLLATPAALAARVWLEYGLAALSRRWSGEEAQLADDKALRARLPTSRVEILWGEARGAAPKPPHASIAAE